MTGYIRTDVGNNIENGEIADATYLDQEFDAIQAAFNSSSGHNHDGTTGEGSPIVQLGPGQDFIASSSLLRPKTASTYDLGSAPFPFKDLYVSGNVIATNGLAGKFGLSGGSAGLPSLYFVGDTDTGIWNSAANQISLYTAGFSRFTIAPSGNVNIPQSLSVGVNTTVTGTVTAGEFSGPSSANDLTSGTVPSARLSGTYSGVTGTGALTTGSIGSGFGNINIGSNTITSGIITSSGTITSGQNFVSSSTNTIIGNDGTGNIYLRPQSVLNSAGQMTLFNNSNVTISGTLTSSGAITGPINATNLTGTVDSARISGNYTGITRVGTLTELTVDNIFIDNNAIRSTTDDSFIQLWGGSTGTTGAIIRTYGASHSTNPNTILNDANRHLFRSANGATNYFDLGSSTLQLGTNISITFAGTGAASTRTNMGIGSLASLDSGTSGTQVRNNTQNDARYLINSNNLNDVTNVSTARSNLGLGTLALQDAGTANNQFRTNTQNDARFHRSGIDTLASGDLPSDASATTWVGARTSSLAVGGIGTYAMLRYGGVNNPGDTRPGSSLTYSNSNGNSSGANPAGTWMCMGLTTNANDPERTTLWLRVS